MIYECREAVSEMLSFEWDTDKAESNRRKHGVTFEVGMMVFRDPLSLTTHDPDHSYDEDRYLTMGTSDRGRLLIISHTDRGERTRIISVQRATRQERRIYEND